MTITGQSIVAKLMALVAVAVMLALSTTLSVSKGPLSKPVADWFAALEAGDAAAFETLLSDDAVIELEDLGISQTKAEFIDSLDQWVELNSGANILTRQTEANEAEVVVEVCYRFSSNEVYNRETYTLSGDQITGSVQEKVGDTCEGF